jgi:dTMP kinase
MERVIRRAAEPQTGGRVVPLPHAADAVRAQHAGVDRMEQLDADFHRRVAKGFLDIARGERDRFVIVDAHVDADSIHRQVRAALHRWLPLPLPETPAAGTSVVDAGSDEDAEAPSDDRRSLG